MGLIKAKKKTNAEVIRGMLAIDEAYRREHEDGQLLSDKVRDTLQELVDTSHDDYELNRRFNNILKPSIPSIKNKK